MTATPSISTSSNANIHQQPLNGNSKVKIITPQSTPSSLSTVALKICLIVGIGVGIVGVGVVGFFASQGQLPGLLSKLQVLGTLGRYGSICVMAGALSLGLVIWMASSVKSCLFKNAGIVDTSTESTKDSKKTEAHKEQHEKSLTIFEICQQGNMTQLASLIDSKRADLNVCNEMGYTPINYAISGGHLRVVEKLIHAGAKVDKKTLFMAVEAGNLEIVKLIHKQLIAFDINSCWEGLTLLHYAVRYGRESLLDYLKEAGADINKGDDFGNNLLHYAVEQKNPAIVLKIASWNEDFLTQKNDQAWSPIELALQTKQNEVFKELFQKFNGKLVVNSGHYFEIALNIDNFEICIFLSKEASSTLTPDQKMFAAIAEGDETKVETYLSPQLCSKEFLTFAAYCGRDNIIRKFLEAGIPIDFVTFSGYTMLHTAAAGGNIGTIKFLLNENAERGGTLDINATNSNGETCFYIAAKKGHHSILDELKNLGIDIHKCNSEGYTSLHAAIFSGDLETVKKTLALCPEALCKESRSPETPLSLAVLLNHADIVQYLCDQPNIDCRQGSETTPLQFAAIEGFVGVGVILMNKDPAGLECVAENKYRALHLAANNGHIDFVNELLSRGALVDSLDPEENTALHLAANNRHVEVVQILLENGANFKLKNKNGHTALDLANKEFQDANNDSGAKDKVNEYAKIVSLLGDYNEGTTRHQPESPSLDMLRNRAQGIEYSSSSES